MPCCHKECDSPTSTITVEIAPGPASIGIPNGMILASCFSAPSCCSSAVAFVPDCLACSMSSPIPIRIIPPAILNAGSVMPNILKIRLPASANEHKTIAQVIAERRATARRSDAGEFAVTAKNKGITANGSTRKNTEVTASSANSRTTLIESVMQSSTQPPRPNHNNILAHRQAAEKSGTNKLHLSQAGITQNRASKQVSGHVQLEFYS